METFTLKNIYDAPVEMIWKAITDREEMKNWYFEMPESFKPVVGSEFDWTAGEPNGKQWLHRGKITEIIEGKKIAHTWEYPGYSGISKVFWELESIDENTTQLLFTHEFTIPFDPKIEAFRRENFVAGWTHILNISLTEFLEKK